MRRIAPLTLAIYLLFTVPALGAPFIERLDAIPDITQTDPKARFPHGGVHLCGPCAVSNSLMWLGENGYEKLVPRSDYRYSAQVDLVNLLASDRYMGTTLEMGTSPAAILYGIEKYVRDCGYVINDLSYEGWRKVPERFHTGVKNPRPDWIRSGFLPAGSAMFLNFGWYRFYPERNEYKRVSGHWVTLAGFGIDRHGNEAPGVLIVHDPGNRPGSEFSNEFVRLEKIRSGTLIAGSGAAHDAAGLFRLSGTMPIHNEADLGILDGAIRLEIKRPPRN
ncbi:MAG: hypothetical protein AAGU11_01050 [Syntrophobacteraceae bacterium]